MIIGTIEVALAIWVVSGWRSRLAAAAQTVLLLVMNGGGLVWGRSAIADPFSTVLNNVVLLALVWIVSDAHV
jgi:DoxX-like protein